MKKNLDFICIGSAKSATSTLFELMENHPQIYMPPAKEVPFFNDESSMKKGWGWYTKTFFSEARENQILGKITPQYMSGTNKYTPEMICENIYEQQPDVRIIVMLRHPIIRSYSQYKMHKRFGYIKDSFEKVVLKILRLEVKELNKERQNLRQDKNVFLFASEYGRILKSYYKLFPRNNILVLYTDNLKKYPEATLKQVFDFLGVSLEYQPPNMSLHTHRGGSAKIKYLAPAYLRKFPIVHYAWKTLVPAKIRKGIFMKISRWNIKPDNDKLNPNSAIYKKLVGYFAEDIKLLESETGTKVPWKEWQEK